MIKNRKSLKILILWGFIASNIFAATLVNGISVIVNNEPITLYEIHKVSRQENVSLNEALNSLIQNRLKDIQIKRLAIKASSFEVSQEIEDIAKKNGMSSNDLLKVVESKGISEKAYRKDISDGIKNRKLFQRVFKHKIPIITNDDIKRYYEKNLSKFSQATSFNITVYSSKTETGLRRALQNPMAPTMGVNIENKDIDASSLDRKKLYFLNQTPVGKFTPVVRSQDGYVAYLVNNKSNATPLSLNEATPLIKEQLSQQNQKMAIDNYFDKLRANAHIEVVRKP